MTKLEELINELCPDGVEYVPIKEITKFEQPTKFIVKSTDYRDDFKIPVLTAGQTFILGYTDETDGIYNASKKQPVIIFDDFTGAFKWVDFPFKVKSSAMKIITANKDVTTLRYIYHVMGHLNFTSSEHKRLWIGIYSAFHVPLPPLSIQSEIVHILDSFTLLTAELTAELTARQKQYAFYRDYLLDFSNEDVTKKIPDIDCSNVEYIKLKDVCKIGDGLHSTPIYDNNGSYYFINGNNLENGRITFTENTKKINISQYERYKIELDDATILMSINGTIGKIALYNREPIILGKSVAYFNVNERILKKYLYYLLQTNRSNAYYEKNLTGSTIKNLGLKALREYQIPLPPIDVQKNIIKILDRFDKLNNDMSEGLPAEIEARKKQYEYYRDTLLSFDDKACSHIVKVERERANTH